MYATGHISSRERRRVQRVWLREPLIATVGSVTIQVSDLSRWGVGVIHDQPLPYIGQPVILTVDWNGRSIDLHCEVRRTSVLSGRSSSFHSGLAILFSDTMSSQALRELIADHIRKELAARKRHRPVQA